MPRLLRDDFTVSGACQDDFTTDEPAIATAHGNWGGAYPPYFYGLMSLFVGVDVPAAVLTMRLVDSLLTVALVAGLAALLPADGDARSPPYPSC